MKKADKEILLRVVKRAVLESKSKVYGLKHTLSRMIDAQRGRKKDLASVYKLMKIDAITERVESDLDYSARKLNREIDESSNDIRETLRLVAKAKEECQKDLDALFILGHKYCKYNGVIPK